MMEELVISWKGRGLGFRLDDFYLSHMIRVDDLLLVANDPVDLQNMANELTERLHAWG